MATNRSQRLRKKLCVDEFQELGFELNLDFKEDLSDEAIDAFLEAFIKEAMEANGLAMLAAMTSVWYACRSVARSTKSSVLLLKPG
jgi:uncharacterized protein YggL (DUF469 family)